MKKIICTVMIFAVFLLPVCAGKASESPYNSYIYSNDDKPLEIAAPYTVDSVLNGEDMGVGALKDLSDVFYDRNDTVYICDSGNSRIVITDKNMKVKKILESFENNGATDSFNLPTGVFSNEDELLVTDSANGRLLLFDKENYLLIKEIKKPKIEILEDESGDYIYIPTQAVMDNAGRFYVIAQGVNQGLIRLNSEGKFISFVGAPSVVPNFFETLWRKFATKAQKERMQQYVPTEYESLLIDENGFIYATSKTSEKAPVVRLNSKGEDINPEVEYYGDSSQKIESENIKLYFVDVAVDKNGVYYVLDNSQGKIYAYDERGILLFAFGDNAFLQGAFYSASALEIIEDKIIVTDRSKGTITVFKRTSFGGHISEAVSLFGEGKDEEARQAFELVLTECSNYLPAIVSISWIDMQNGNYENALTQLKTIRDHSNYSKAFERIRNDLIREWFVRGALVFIILGVAAFFAFKLIKKTALFAKITKSSLYKDYKYSNYVIFHPFDGFWDINHEKKGNVKSATLILCLFTVLFALRAQFSGYIVTKTISAEVNALFSCAMILMPLCFWIIANWCFTTLMDGKGSLKDIYIFTCYSLKPYVLLALPLLIMSHVLTSNEAMFYYLLNSVGLIWIIGLLFFGMITVHDYSLAKGIVTAVLSIVGICVIIFLLLLMVSVVQNILDFILNIYKEISLRSYF